MKKILLLSALVSALVSNISSMNIKGGLNSLLDNHQFKKYTQKNSTTLYEIVVTQCNINALFVFPLEDMDFPMIISPSMDIKGGKFYTKLHKKKRITYHTNQGLQESKICNIGAWKLAVKDKGQLDGIKKFLDNCKDACNEHSNIEDYFYFMILDVEDMDGAYQISFNRDLNFEYIEKNQIGTLKSDFPISKESPHLIQRADIHKNRYNNNLNQNDSDNPKNSIKKEDDGDSLFAIYENQSNKGVQDDGQVLQLEMAESSKSGQNFPLNNNFEDHNQLLVNADHNQSESLQNHHLDQQNHHLDNQQNYQIESRPLSSQQRINTAERSTFVHQSTFINQNMRSNDYQNILNDREKMLELQEKELELWQRELELRQRKLALQQKEIDLKASEDKLELLAKRNKFNSDVLEHGSESQEGQSGHKRIFLNNNVGQRGSAQYSIMNRITKKQDNQALIKNNMN